jgi:hypothetical protein
VQFLLFNWAEVKRWYDIKNPGSQGDGSFFGITDDFKGVENGYPGEAGDEEQHQGDQQYVGAAIELQQFRGD